MDANNDDINLSINLAEEDRKNQKSPEQIYLAKFGIKPARDLSEQEFEPLSFFMRD